MPTMQRIAKPKTQRGKRALLKREPKLIENTKTAMFLRGTTCSQTVINCMKDLVALKKPHATYFSSKKEFRPFEDVNKLEFFGRKSDASLFAFGSHSKKKPDNTIFGRLYDYHLLDMIELGIEAYKGLNQFKLEKIALGTKPCLMFVGEPFDAQPEYQRLKSLFIDFFRGDDVTGLRLAGVEHVLLFAAIDGKIHFRSYKILMKKSGSKVPRIELDEMGPSVDFSLHRTRLASDDLFAVAKRQPRQLKRKNVKNISKSKLGSKMGRVHMQKQNLNRLQTRKLKGLKKTAEEQKRERTLKRQRLVTAASLQSDNGSGSLGSRLHFTRDEPSKKKPQIVVA